MFTLNILDQLLFFLGSTQLVWIKHLMLFKIKKLIHDLQYLEAFVFDVFYSLGLMWCSTVLFKVCNCWKMRIVHYIYIVSIVSYNRDKLANNSYIFNLQRQFRNLHVLYTFRNNFLKKKMGLCRTIL